MIRLEQGKGDIKMRNPKEKTEWIRQREEEKVESNKEKAANNPLEDKETTTIHIISIHLS